MAVKKRSLTGIKPSGDPHIGNYLGMIRPALKLQETYDCIYFIADLHALTTVRSAKELHGQTMDLVATWIACGLDTDRHIMFRQSDLPMVAEFAWYLSCCTGTGLLDKAHAYKDAQTKQKEPNLGLYYYPVLMAADILMYDVDIVPVGKDQKQHVEMARDMAGSFNHAFSSDVIKLCQPLIDEKVMTIPGLDGQKMSKSYNNVIPLFADEKALRKTVLSLKTDSTPLEAPKSMEDTVLGELFGLFATNSQYTDLNQRLAAGGLGWGHAKEELFEAINKEIAPLRARYHELRADERFLTSELDKGAKKGFEIGVAVLDRVRVAVGARKFGLNWTAGL